MPSYANDLTPLDITNKIIHHADASLQPKETLVQWYYAVDGLIETAKQQWNIPTQVSTLEQVKTTLRREIDQRKSVLKPLRIQQFYNEWKHYLTGNSLWNACKDKLTLVDDWSYALDLPTALVLATWDMESSCNRYNPANGDGIFQLVAKDYGTQSQLTTGTWITMMYDYSKLVKDKILRYSNANSLSSSLCADKNVVNSGQVAPVCLSYTTLDMDSIIKYGALYNGLANATIKGNIQPHNDTYVYGKFGLEYRTRRKEGIILRVLKALDYINTRGW